MVLLLMVLQAAVIIGNVTLVTSELATHKDGITQSCGDNDSGCQNGMRHYKVNTQLKTPAEAAAVFFGFEVVVLTIQSILLWIWLPGNDSFGYSAAESAPIMAPGGSDL